MLSFCKVNNLVLIQDEMLFVYKKNIFCLHKNICYCPRRRGSYFTRIKCSSYTRRAPCSCIKGTHNRVQTKTMSSTVQYNSYIDLYRHMAGDFVTHWNYWNSLEGIVAPMPLALPLLAASCTGPSRDAWRQGRARTSATLVGTNHAEEGDMGLNLMDCDLYRSESLWRVSVQICGVVWGGKVHP